MSVREPKPATNFSARLKPMPVRAEPTAAAPVARPTPADNEPPPWLDAPMADESGEPLGMDAMDERDDGPGDAGGPAEVGSYASTAGTPVALVPTSEGERWAELVRGVEITALTRTLAMQAQCLSFEDGPQGLACRLRVESDSLRQPVIKDKLQAVLSAALDKPVTLEVEAGVAQDSPALRDQAAGQARQREAEQIVVDDPVAKALMSQFKTARIVPGSIRPLH